jgi:hypothetical protein
VLAVTLALCYAAEESAAVADSKVEETKALKILRTERRIMKNVEFTNMETIIHPTILTIIIIIQLKRKRL